MRQIFNRWAMIHGRAEPAGFSAGADGTTYVDVHQTVRDLKGNVLSDKMVGHIFRMEDGLITRFDIRQCRTRNLIAEGLPLMARNGPVGPV
jgi:hypothetical protein